MNPGIFYLKFTLRYHHNKIKSLWQLNIRHSHPQLWLYKELGELAQLAVTRGILTGREEVQRRTRERAMFSKVTIFLGIISVAAFQECKYLCTIVYQDCVHSG